MAPTVKSASPVKTTYLVLYNFLSAIAWATVLGRTVSINALRGPEFVFLVVGEWTRWTQTAALLEVVHAAVGAAPQTRSTPESGPS
jgi:very-long-chain (3R)-3-hydroxyacyl-CoA dehydratase